MSLCKEQIEHLERYLGGRPSSRRWRKKQFSRFIKNNFFKKKYFVHLQYKWNLLWT